LSGVLFDLDGTLLDSAPGLYAALDAYCRESGTPVPPYARVRQVVSRGARAVLRTAFGDDDDQALLDRLPHYLEIYATVMNQYGDRFDGIEQVLALLEAAGVPWGVVTNKAGFLTDPLLAHLGISQRAASVVSGDTLAERKPHPAPVLHACKLAGMEPAASVFVGDDLRDIEAGRSAGLYTVAAAWGYLDGGNPHDWLANAVATNALDLIRLLRLRSLA
jgi:phosphoglycolate phosphatase